MGSQQWWQRRNHRWRIQILPIGYGLHDQWLRLRQRNRSNAIVPWYWCWICVLRRLSPKRHKWERGYAGNRRWNKLNPSGLGHAEDRRRVAKKISAMSDGQGSNNRYQSFRWARAAWPLKNTAIPRKHHKRAVPAARDYLAFKSKTADCDAFRVESGSWL